VKFGRIVLQVNTHQLTELDFLNTTSYFPDAIISHGKCCHLVFAHAAFARRPLQLGCPLAILSTVADSQYMVIHS